MREKAWMLGKALHRSTNTAKARLHYLKLQTQSADTSRGLLAEVYHDSRTVASWRTATGEGLTLMWYTLLGCG